MLKPFSLGMIATNPVIKLALVEASNFEVRCTILCKYFGFGMDEAGRKLREYVAQSPGGLSNSFSWSMGMEGLRLTGSRKFFEIMFRKESSYDEKVRRIR